MRKIWLMIVVVALMSLTVGCSSKNDGNSAQGCSTLKVYNWGVYIGNDVKSDFEKEFGVKVIYDQFASNEEMYTKLLSGESYDVLYPSDYMIERLIQENSLMKVNLTKIPNFSNIKPEVLNWDYDPDNEYSVPYFWGNVGLLYNSKNVSYSDLTKEGFNIMLNPKYVGKIYVYDSERDAFMIAFKALGYSMNTTNSDEIEQAYQWLIKQKQTMKPVFVTDDSIDNMVAGLKDIAMMYSGDAVYVMSENEDMDFYVPESGSNLWVDAMVIPANSKCAELAHKWINYQLQPEIALENTLEVGYSSTITEVYDEVIAEGGEFFDYHAYQIRTEHLGDEIFRYNEAMKKELADLWTRVKVS